MLPIDALGVFEEVLSIIIRSSIPFMSNGDNQSSLSIGRIESTSESCCKSTCLRAYWHIKQNGVNLYRQYNKMIDLYACSVNQALNHMSYFRILFLTSSKIIRFISQSSKCISSKKVWKFWLMYLLRKWMASFLIIKFGPKCLFMKRNITIVTFRRISSKVPTYSLKDSRNCARGIINY